MKAKTPRNIAASHRAKLLNLAQERGEGFQFFLGRWISERFLFLLGRSAHRDQFIRTPLPSATPVALSEGFLLDENKQTQWKAFGNRSGLDLPTLQSVGAAIEEFVMPVLGAEDALDLVWTAPGPWR